MTDTSARAPRLPVVEAGQVRHYAPDMTVSAAADVTLDALQAVLGEAGQWLPIDGPGEAAVGALVALNSTGPLRQGYGAWRDLLLGVQFHNGLGELITAGGRAVKNVAGYDLVKLMVGQGGCLGELVTITTRTYRRPEAALRAQFAPSAAIFAALLASPCRPQWAILREDDLCCGYLGDEAARTFYETALREHKPRTVQRLGLEEDVRRRQSLWSLGRQPVWRVTAPPARIEEFIAAAGRPAGWSADPAFGVVLLPADTGAAPTAATAQVGGTFYRAALGQAPQWQCADAVEQRILREVKKALDPEGRLAPLPTFST